MTLHSITGHSTPLLERLPETMRGVVGYGRPRLPDGESGAHWHGMALAGRLVELSGGGATACLTFAIGQVAAAQGRGENVAWIAASPTPSSPRTRRRAGSIWRPCRWSGHRTRGAPPAPPST